MGKMKLYELAKELNLASKELLKKVKELGIEVKSHLSSLEDSDVEKIRKTFSSTTNNTKNSKESRPEKNKPQEQSNKNEKSNPVIIKREVIIEHEEKNENVKKEQKNKNPFVQRKQNKD